MPRKRTFGILALVILLVPPALLVLAVLVVESEWAERRIERYAGERLNREVRLDEIDLRFAWPPQVHLQTLRVSNPPWAETGDLIDAEDLEAIVQFRPLLDGQVVIDRLTVARGQAGLEKEDGRATWRFGERDDEPGRFHLQEAELGDAKIFYRNAAEQTALHIRGTGALEGADASLELQAEGRFHGEPATARAKAPVIPLSGGRPIRGSLEATVGTTSGSANGTIRIHEGEIRTLDAKVELDGRTLAHLHEVFGLNLPNTPPYSFGGNLHHEQGLWAAEDFAGEVGDSDLRGSWSYDTRGEKPTFTADLTSRRLELNDLAPIIGAGQSASSEHARASAARGDILPEHELATQRWSQMNADVKLKAARVDARPELPITALTAHLTLQDAVLKLQPLTFEAAGGTIENEIVMNAKVEPPRGELQMNVKQLDLSRLFPELESMDDALGRMSGRADLVGRGRSVARLLGTSSGEASLAVSGGRISALLVEVLGLDLAESLAVLAADNPQTPLNCAVADVAVKNGVATTRAFVIDTRDTLVQVEGTIDLREERLNLLTSPKPKDPSLFSARTPVHLTGSWRDPDVDLKRGPLVGRVAAAGLLALVNPLLALVPFIEPGTGEDANCRALLARARNASN